MKTNQRRIERETNLCVDNRCWQRLVQINSAGESWRCRTNDVMQQRGETTNYAKRTDKKETEMCSSSFSAKFLMGGRWFRYFSVQNFHCEQIFLTDSINTLISAMIRSQHIQPQKKIPPRSRDRDRDSGSHATGACCTCRQQLLNSKF